MAYTNKRKFIKRHFPQSREVATGYCINAQELTRKDLRALIDIPGKPPVSIKRSGTGVVVSIETDE